MENSQPATPAVEDIAAELDVVASNLATLQMRPDFDPFASTHAYVKVLAAQAELNEFLNGLPSLPESDLRPGDVATLIDQLRELTETLGAFAQAAGGAVGLASTRAALNLHDARACLIGAQ